MFAHPGEGGRMTKTNLLPGYRVEREEVLVETVEKRLVEIIQHAAGSRSL